jgi:hypothetical protein
VSICIVTVKSLHRWHIHRELGSVVAAIRFYTVRRLMEAQGFDVQLLPDNGFSVGHASRSAITLFLLQHPGHLDGFTIESVV